jgi:hypothetical protein
MGTAHKLSPNGISYASGKGLAGGIGEFAQAAEVALGNARASVDFHTYDALARRLEHQVDHLPAAVRKCEAVPAVSAQRRWHRGSCTATALQAARN